MTKLHVKYLLVGGGLASCSAAKAIRERDADGPVLLVGQEITRPYHRPALSKTFLRREAARESLFVVPPGWFNVRHIDLRTGRRVARLDTARRSAALDNGEEVSFDTMLLATGAVPAPLKVPGADLPNLFGLRTFEDASLLHHAIDQAKAGGRPHARGRGRVAVIGAGVLGVELAGSFTQMGLAVDLIEQEAHPWHRFVGEATGNFLSRFLEKHGVTVHAKSHLQRLDGDGRVQRAIVAGPADTGAQVYPCDFAVTAIGSMTNRELLRGTPLAAEKALLVDDHCRTNVPGIYAAGDCCTILDPLFGKYRWIDHWENASLTGAIAGSNMAGANVRYDVVSHFSAEVFGLQTKVWGEARVVDRRLLRGTPNIEAPDFVEIGIAADGKVAQVVSVGHPGEDDAMRELVARRLLVDGNEEMLKDPGVTLENVLR
jgi:NADPH-dependent 2,4-dienoyl-CoA reductase/sulfur reductase-like enzyme